MPLIHGLTVLRINQIKSILLVRNPVIRGPSQKLTSSSETCTMKLSFSLEVTFAVKVHFLKRFRVKKKVFMQ